MASTRKIQKYGWRPDLPDARDKVLAVARPVVLPATADLRGPHMPPIYDQGDLGSCTANGIAAAFDFERSMQNLPFMAPSRLAIYYGERAIEGDVSDDSGAQIRDGIKVTLSGVGPESLWPYDPSKFAEKPSSAYYAEASKHRTMSYSRVTQLPYFFKHCIGILGRPIPFGFTVYESFESDAVAQSGVVPLPGPGERSIGGHCVCAVGYDDHKGMFLCRNSWGTGWGIAGYFWMPYSYVLSPDLADDPWVILSENA